jgi:hypothetical protein
VAESNNYTGDLMGHITGCRTVYNWTQSDCLVIKLESPDRKLFISQVAVSRSFEGEAVPWCEDAEQIVSKAFVFFRNAHRDGGGFGMFYVFQDREGQVCWTPYLDGNPSYEHRTRGPVADAVNISIHVNDTAGIAIS